MQNVAVVRPSGNRLSRFFGVSAHTVIHDPDILCHKKGEKEEVYGAVAPVLIFPLPVFQAGKGCVACMDCIIFCTGCFWFGKSVSGIRIS